MIEESAGIEKVHIEGMEEIVDQYSIMVDTMKKKTYDLLDFRRHEVWSFFHLFTQFDKYRLNVCSFVFAPKSSLSSHKTHAPEEELI
jgi:hypothetical protein